MNATWSDKLENGGIVLVDGGTGTELRRRGFAMHGHAWSATAALSHSELLTRVHADYIAAGADVVTANTFATSRFVLEAAGLGERFAEINQASLDAAFRARDASGRDVSVAASLSCLPPCFDSAAYPDAETEHAAYTELAALFAARGVDLILLEMMQAPEHTARACAAAAASGTPWWLGLSCRSAQGRLVAFDAPDIRIATTLERALGFAPRAVTVMHSTPEATPAALELVAAHWPGPYGAYPETGEDAPALTPAALAGEAGRWIEAGARIVGGCCGTTPDHVRALRDLVAP